MVFPIVVSNEIHIHTHMHMHRYIIDGGLFLLVGMLHPNPCEIARPIVFSFIFLLSHTGGGWWDEVVYLREVTEWGDEFTRPVMAHAFFVWRSRMRHNLSNPSNEIMQTQYDWNSI